MGSDVSLSKAVRANLLSLQNTASMMDKTQNRLATGNKVNSALDNPSSFFTASALNSRAADMSNLLDSMASGIKVIEAANNGITALTKNLESMQSTLRQARQDKSFQTKSFEVNDNTKINLGGGQFGDLDADISLATATVPGVKSVLTTDAATAYLGPQSATGSAQGAGARSVISGLTGFSATDSFTVAGVNVTLGAGAQTATTIKGSIETALANDTSTAGKYTVSVGTGANANKLIIETVDPSAAAAAINLDPDSDAATGVDSATKGAVTFNYSAVNTSITAGGQTVQTGATFEDFVANLQAKATAGGYTVEADATTKDIKLTNTQWGGAVPTVSGVPAYAAGTPAVKASTAFTLNTAEGAQTLTVAGETIAVGDDATDADVLGLLTSNTNLTTAFDITSDGAFGFTLTAKTAATGPAPTVTSDKTHATVATPATTGLQLTGVDFTGTGSGLQAYDGQTITVGSQSFTFNGTDNDTTQGAALKAALEGGASGLTVTLTAAGFSIADANGTDFTVETTADSDGLASLGTALGATGAANAATNDSATLLAGIDFASGSADDMDAYVGATISVGGSAPLAITAGVDADDFLTALQTAIGSDYVVAADANAGFTITRTDGASFDIDVSGGLGSAIGAGSGTLTVNNGTEAVDGALAVNGNEVSSGISASTGTPGVTGVPEVDGIQSVVAAVPGASVETIAAEENTFTVSYDGKTANISVGGVKGGVGSAVNALDIKNWQDATIEAVNGDLEAAGITGVEAKFDAAGKFQLVAKTAEAKTLAVSGDDAVSLFGTNGVNTGTAEKSQLNATKTVDKFVELINRDHGTKVRASNDNGKLRIENLSTQDLDIGIDLNGNDAVTALKVEGNTQRSNLAKQFNESRDQLDKLGDDASFNGINLLRGDKLKITFNESGTSSIDIQAKDKNGNVRGINASNLGIDSLVAEDLDTDEKIDAFLTKLSTALGELRSQASSFGSNLSSVENRQSFTKNMINTLETGAANLTLADTNEEAANLLALQTRQQLSSSALSMASQQDQAVLQLLR